MSVNLAESNERLKKLLRSPTLETVRMVEMCIEKYSGELKKTQLWEKLPRKVMWSSFVTILNYLIEINKIIISDEGVITYIWSPVISRKFKLRKSY